MSVTLGDNIASVEDAVAKMLDFIGRDVSDLTFTPNATAPGTDLPTTDPDVAIAWRAFQEVYAETSTKFWAWNTVELDVSVASGQYLLPDPDTDNDDDPYFGNTTSGVAVARVKEQPADLDLVYRDGTGTTGPHLFDRKTNSNTGFAGKGDVTLEIAFFIKWEIIPLPVRRYIVAEAAVRFVGRAATSESQVAFAQEARNMAFQEMEAFDLEMRPPNAFTDGMLTLPGITDRFPF